MYLDPESKIAGMPALSIKKFLNKHQIVSQSLIAKRFNISERIAGMVLKGLLDEGYLKYNEFYSKHGEVSYHLTLKGCTLALASSAKPLKRNMAEKILGKFLERVQEVNTNEYFLYRVDKAVVFGSYLSNQEKINDIDIAVVLMDKHGRKEQYDKDMKRIADVEASGKQFPNISSRIGYPTEEVMLYLKSRSRAISLHTDIDGILKVADRKKIYPAGEDQEEVRKLDVIQRRILCEACYNASANWKKNEEMMRMAKDAVAAAGFAWTADHELFVSNWYKPEL